VQFFKKLDDQALASLKDGHADLIWFTDLGSGSASKIEGTSAVITDHHAPEATAQSQRNRGQALLSDFSTVIQVNPHLNGVSGASELSGAGSTFLAAYAMDSRNADLATLAVLGAIGDLQDQRMRKLEGVNRTIMNLAQESGTLEAVQDIRYFGRETRPLHRLLQFSSDPFLPRISGNEEGALGLLLELGIELKDGDAWRSWSDLTKMEKDSILSALRDHLSSMKRRPEVIDRLVGEVYVFQKEKKGSPVRDAKEFATLLNACGRHGKAEVGLAICIGDRNGALEEGLVLLRDHRSAISQALTWAKGSGVIRMKNIQFFDAGDEIEDTIVGTVAGMLLGSEGADRTAPMVAFAESTEYSDEPKMKASARGTQDLVSRGMDLSAAMRNAAERVGGVGGGHNIAAGATIPADKRDEFLDALDSLVCSQLSARGQRRG
jgi:single-stranded-DNA-specific exonuclease